MYHECYVNHISFAINSIINNKTNNNNTQEKIILIHQIKISQLELILRIITIALKPS